MTKPATEQFLLGILRTRVSNEQWRWLQTAVSAATKGGEQEVLSCYTAASRRLGKAALNLSTAERNGLAEFGSDFNLNAWSLDEFPRAVVLLALTGCGNYEEIAQRCYDLGDSREQQSWLLSLSLLPNAQVFLDTRTNIIPVFEAIASENRYPSIHFPELKFNQIALKRLFNDIGLVRVVGLVFAFES